MAVVNRSFDNPLEPEEHAVMPFAGGIMQHGYQCGMIWGASLAAGAGAYRLFGPGPEAEAGAIVASQRIVESFRAQNGHIDCFDITGMHESSTAMRMVVHFLLKGGTVHCFRMAARYAKAVHGDIKAVISGAHLAAPPDPLSCSAELAKRMGASDMHAVMAAGFAGGIGLSGGACGALGAAIWLIVMKNGGGGSGKVDFKNPRAQDAVNRFLKCTDYEFECATITGRRFENIAEHAAYMRRGGCARLIEALAAGG